jgi:hypothetical protein
MDIYINGTSCISSFDSQKGLQVADEGRFVCIEPDYKTIIDARQLRRMSRIMRMGLATALKALESTSAHVTGAIITATGMGCLDDTGNFLVKMCDPDNRMMNPTAFIQSIHNTMGGQIGLYTRNNCYNTTYTQGVLSFEHALLDAFMLLNEGEAENVLVGGIDELTELKHEITSRLYLARKENQGFYGQGEGCAFFNLSTTPSFVKLRAVILSHEKKHEDILEYISLQQHNDMKTLMFTGKNGGNSDKAYYSAENVIGRIETIEYKKYCGDYPTASAFALWLANEMLRGNISVIQQFEITNDILIYHAYSNSPHTLIHLTRC